MCRKKLTDLVAVAEANKRAFVWGTSGGGKSYLVNTFAFHKLLQHHLDSDEPRILWLPDWNDFARGRTEIGGCDLHCVLRPCRRVSRRC
jgi:hypothetical protein